MNAMPPNSVAAASFLVPITTILAAIINSTIINITIIVVKPPEIVIAIRVLATEVEGTADAISKTMTAGDGKTVIIIEKIAIIAIANMAITAVTAIIIIAAAATTTTTQSLDL